jgi:hypothetical protein
MLRLHLDHGNQGIEVSQNAKSMNDLLNRRDNQTIKKLFRSLKTEWIFDLSIELNESGAT